MMRTAEFSVEHYTTQILADLLPRLEIAAPAAQESGLRENLSHS